LIRKISNSLLVEYETQIALMPDLEIMSLKFPYSMPAQTVQVVREFSRIVSAFRQNEFEYRKEE
jgi:hypothetical protein